MFSRKKAAMLVAEFLGTGVLTLVFLSVTKSALNISYFVAIAAGLVIAAMVLVFGAVSGAHLNPAVTIGLWSVRRIKTLPAIVYIVAQLLGGAAAYLLFKYFIGQELHVEAKFDTHIMVAEAVGAFIFALGWAATVYQRLTTSQTATVLGLSFVVAVLASSIAVARWVDPAVLSSPVLNPAVALGAHVWIWFSYVLGPVLGAIIGFNLYALLFAPESSLKWLSDRTAKKTAPAKGTKAEEVEKVKEIVAAKPAKNASKKKK
jgi:glycerol uptake facilitator protein